MFLVFRRHPDLNWGIKDLQSSALPLGYAADFFFWYNIHTFIITNIITKIRKKSRGLSKTLVFSPIKNLQIVKVKNLQFLHFVVEVAIAWKAIAYGFWYRRCKQKEKTKNVLFLSIKLYLHIFLCVNTIFKILFSFWSCLVWCCFIII